MVRGDVQASLLAGRAATEGINDCSKAIGRSLGWLTGFPATSRRWYHLPCTQSYRIVKEVRKPGGRGLNDLYDLYVRFFRMAEQRIPEKPGRVVVCFISNYSWLDGLFFTRTRECYLEASDTIRIDCLNEDKYNTGKMTADGRPDPSIFSTPGDPVGTTIATLVRKVEHGPAETVGFRHLWGQSKLMELTDTAEAEPAALDEDIEPVLPFAEVAVNRGWSEWPLLPDLFPK